jgi:hypothetical protein
MEPPERLRRACQVAGVPDGIFDTVSIGDTVTVKVARGE